MSRKSKRRGRVCVFYTEMWSEVDSAQPARDTHDADNILCLWQQLDIYDAIKMCDLFVRRKAYSQPVLRTTYSPTRQKACSVSIVSIRVRFIE